MFQKVPGTYRSTGGVTGTRRGKIWAMWAIGGRHTSPQGGGTPPPGTSLNWTMGGGDTPLSFSFSLSFPLFPSDKYLIHSGTLLVSEYYRPIYESLPLDHFETPRHVRDLIRDSEQHSVTKSHNSYNTKSSSNVKCADPTGSRTM